MKLPKRLVRFLTGVAWTILGVGIGIEITLIAACFAHAFT